MSGRAAAGWLAALWLGLAGMAEAKPVVLDPAGMRQLAAEVLNAGQAEDALALTEALLQRDPQDVTALVLQSQALRMLGRMDESRQMARRAWAAAETDEQKFSAAVTRAQVLSAEGRRTAAQFWLRRAVQVAPTEEAQALAERDFRYVRARNPWVFAFDLSVAPSSNVNNGSSRGTFDLIGIEDLPIPEDMKALSGLDIAFGTDVTYRLPATDWSRTEFGLGLLTRQVVLSADAKLQAPSAEASDYAYDAVELGVTHRRLAFAPLRYAEFGALVGHNWYGGASMSNYVQANFGMEDRTAPGRVLGFDIMGVRTWRLDSDTQSNDQIIGSFGIDQAFGEAGILSVDFVGRQVYSESPELAGTGYLGSIGWEFADPLPGDITLSASIGVGYRTYPNSNYADGGRQDRTQIGDVSFGINQLTYLGFVPTVSLTAARTRSNAALFDTRSLGINIGYESAF